MAKHNKVKNGSWFTRHKILSWIGIVVLVILVTISGVNWYNNFKVSQYQKSIQPFYTPPNPLPSTQPGYLIRSEPMNINVSGGTAYRILYVSQTPNNQPTVSSGMLFVPTVASTGERKVVAWAHGTQGFGDTCTPSRSQNPLNDLQNWLPEMMQRGWVVVATDYAGLGTPGDPYYLIGSSEAHDVLNSVRAAQSFNGSQAGNQFVVAGHSQGGHSSLFTAQLAHDYAPDLKLVAAAGAAPAAELTALFNQQYNQAVAWAIGPDVAVSWPLVYPGIDIKSVISSAGMRNYQRLAYGCVQQQILGIEIRNDFHQQFFSANPMQNSGWYQTSTDQTPETAKINVPVYIAQGMNDTVVLPNTTALLVQNLCKTNTQITTNWLGNTNHLQVAEEAGPSLVGWFQDRFDNVALSSDCSQSLPVSPATVPVAP